MSLRILSQEEIDARNLEAAMWWEELSEGRRYEIYHFLSSFDTREVERKHDESVARFRSELRHCDKCGVDYHHPGIPHTCFPNLIRPSR